MAAANVRSPSTADARVLTREVAAPHPPGPSQQPTPYSPPARRRTHHDYHPLPLDFPRPEKSHSRPPIPAHLASVPAAQGPDHVCWRLGWGEASGSGRDMSDPGSPAARGSGDTPRATLRKGCRGADPTERMGPWWRKHPHRARRSGGARWRWRTLRPQTERTSTISGTKCFNRFSMPWRSVAVELGQPEQAPRMVRLTTPSR